MKDAPIVYKIILQKFKSRSIADRIETQVARNILGAIFHLPKEKHSSILQEMHDLELIVLSNSKFIGFNCKLRDIEITN